MPATLPGDGLCFNLSGAHKRRQTIVMLVLAIVLIGSSVVKDGAAGFGTVLGIAIALPFAAWLNGRTSITVSDTQVAGPATIGQRSVRQRTDVASIVRASIPMSPFSRRTYTNLFVLDGDGKPILRMQSPKWDEADIERAAVALGGPVIDLGTTTAKELGEHYPRVVPPIERHPVMQACVVVTFFTASVTAFVWYLYTSVS